MKSGFGEKRKTKSEKCFFSEKLKVKSVCAIKFLK